MKQKLKRFMGLMLTLAMVMELMPEMRLKVYAEETAYSYLIPTNADDTTALASKVVKFNNIDWYIIADNSTAESAGTVTLLAKDPIGDARVFDSSTNTKDYGKSQIKDFLKELTDTGEFSSVKDCIADTDITDVTTHVTGAKLYLLNKTEANSLPANVLKSTMANGCQSNNNYWWLRTPDASQDSQALRVSGDEGAVKSGNFVYWKFGVRPALKLDLSSVIFSSGTNTFSLKPSGYSVTITGGANATTSGGAISQTGLTGAMTTVTYTANTGYYFAEFADITDNGITAKRTSSSVVTVSGTPTADATIKVPDAVTNDEADDTQQNPDGTKTVTKENADGKTISVTNYSKTDEQISQFIFKKAKGTTVDLTNVDSKNLKTVVVPESVKANGITYKVTRIRKGFLKNCKQATKVDIGKNINTIDKNAFNYGKKVQKVIIRGKLKKVGKYAFKKTKKNVAIKVKTSAKNFEKNKKLLEKSGLPTNATVKRVKNKK